MVIPEWSRSSTPLRIQPSVRTAIASVSHNNGYLKGCLNRNDDLQSMGEMSRTEIRETLKMLLQTAFHTTVNTSLKTMTASGYATLHSILLN